MVNCRDRNYRLTFLNSICYNETVAEILLSALDAFIFYRISSMEPSNNLEIKGSLQSNPFAELICEINRHRFSGSVRLSNETQKVVVYFDTGAIIFAVSNARQHRFYETILQTRKISKDQLVAIADFTNDLALKDNLIVNNLLEKSEVDALFAHLIENILQNLTAWQTGEWIFSPLVRLKSDVKFQVDAKNVLINYARNLPSEEINRKFRNIKESFKSAEAMPLNVNLTPRESFVYSRFENDSMTPEEIKTLSGLPESETFQIIYNLWLGGFLERQNWNSAFSERYVASVSTTRMSAKKDEPKPDAQPPVKKVAPAIEPPKPEVVETVEVPEEPPPVEEKQISLDEYLARTTAAQNFYEMFDLSPDSTTADIKKSYFAIAKRFHPDLFHRETEAGLHQRIQDAFSNLARAYEVLKDSKSREVYDFKMRKELAEMRERLESGVTEEEIDVQVQIDQATQNFDQGFDYLMDGEYESATPYLARAVFYAKENARFHAYYGKALANDAKHSHQAESELHTAIKLDGKNADYRIMLAEFYIQIELFKRAEGELKRLLAIFPTNGEARILLDTLTKK
jgi:DnaJ domain/Domain of unknown function (DUF4388)